MWILLEELNDKQDVALHGQDDKLIILSHIGSVVYLQETWYA